MLSRAVGGAYGFATDIGGYFDYNTPPTDKQLFLRWAEWAALSPVFRLHGSGRTGRTRPGRTTRRPCGSTSSCPACTCAPGPCSRSCGRRRTAPAPRRPGRCGGPIPTRTGWQQDQEWLLGPDLLVAPVVEQDATSRSVYLPQGCWRLHGTGDRRTGERSVTVKAGLATPPWFSRCGTTPLG